MEGLYLKGYYNMRVNAPTALHVVEGLYLKGYYNLQRLKVLCLYVVEGLYLKGYYNGMCGIAFVIVLWKAFI